MIINLEVFCKYVEYYIKSYLLIKSFIIFLEAPLQHIIQSLYRVLIFLGFFFSRYTIFCTKICRMPYYNICINSGAITSSCLHTHQVIVDTVSACHCIFTIHFIHSLFPALIFLSAWKVAFYSCHGLIFCNCLSVLLLQIFCISWI